MGYQMLPGLLLSYCIFIELSPLEKYQFHKVSVIIIRIYRNFGHARAWPHLVILDCFSLVFSQVWCMGYQMLYIFIRVFALELVGLEKNITKLHFKPPKLVIFPTVKQLFSLCVCVCVCVCVMLFMSVSVWQFVWWGVREV